MLPGQKSQPSVDALAYVRKGAAEVIREEELKAKLAHSAKTGKPLRVYLGVDPTAPDLHLGHTVVLRKLKHFQDLGHTAIFLIGDFSAMIGDPTGQSETRPPLTRAEVDANAKTYLEQVYKILDRQKTEVRYNSEWLDKLSSAEIIRLCAKYPLARMLEREDFRTRLTGGWKGELFRPSEEAPGSRQGNEPDSKLPSGGKVSPGNHPPSLAIHELLYPLLTALDAVELKSDVELGATEQKFNLLVHRDIQREYGLPGQVCMTMPILVGLDGERKMSKSLGNYVGISEPPKEMYGKLMSISDGLMWRYYELLTDIAPDVLAALRNSTETPHGHPMIVKMELARRIVADFHGPDAARHAMEEFRRVFRERKAPEDSPVVKLALGPPKRLSALLVELGLVESRAEADRLIKQGGVEIENERVDDVKREIELSKPSEFLLRAGKKKFLRVVIE
jgi:tyrosyl-tRNA synthetase